MADEGRRGNATGGAFLGSFWVAGWLFSIGFLGLPFWKALLALIIWPYYLGAGLH